MCFHIQFFMHKICFQFSAALLCKVYPEFWCKMQLSSKEQSLCLEGKEEGNTCNKIQNWVFGCVLSYMQAIELSVEFTLKSKGHLHLHLYLQLGLHLHTFPFHQSTIQPQMTLDMEQVLYTRHD